MATMERVVEFTHSYWSRNELGRAMLASNYVTANDLWFLIPNNVKRRNGFPATRVSARRKSDYKQKQRRHILAFKLFDILEQTVEEILPKKIDEQFATFVDVRDAMKV